ALAGIMSMGEGSDVTGGNGLHFVDECQNIGDAVGDLLQIGRVQVEACQMGVVLHVLTFDGHSAKLPCLQSLPRLCIWPAPSARGNTPCVIRISHRAVIRHWQSPVCCSEISRLLELHAALAMIGRDNYTGRFPLLGSPKISHSRFAEDFGSRC